MSSDTVIRDIIELHRERSHRERGLETSRFERAFDILARIAEENRCTRAESTYRRSTSERRSCHWHCACPCALVACVILSPSACISPRNRVSFRPALSLWLFFPCQTRQRRSTGISRSRKVPRGSISVGREEKGRKGGREEEERTQGEGWLKDGCDARYSLRRRRRVEAPRRSEPTDRSADSFV